MFLGITNDDREDLARPCEYWVKDLSDANRESITQAVEAVFSDWRARQSPRELDTLALPVSFVDPTEPGVGDVALAFELWLNRDAAFSKLVAEHGLPTVFAMVGWVSRSVAAPLSLARLNGLLVQILLDKLDDAEYSSQRFLRAYKERREREKKNARAALKTAVDTKKSDSVKLRKQYHDAAYDYMVNNLTARQDALLDHLESLNLGKKAEGDKSTARSTIKRLIAGVMEKARKAARTKSSLYATDRKGKP